MDYLLRLGQKMGLPVSINVSLGTNGHSHDGSAAVTRWIDAALAAPGRAVTVAAGNSGQEKGETEDDLGWIMGRIHASGAFPAAGLEQDLEWVVVGNGIMDLSENELEIWYSAQDRFAISIKPPGMDWIGPVEPREFIQNRMLPDGTMLSAYNEVFHPANGLNYISVYLSPFLQPPQVIGVPAGTWIVRLHSREVRDGRYHAWIERDDPQRLGRVGEREAWSFPSFFTERTLVDDSTVSSLGCGSRVITVANLDAVRNQISISSSQGPTRDGREKPDIAAPGTDIVAAKGFAGDPDEWLGLSGTSMASPLVAGVVGLMLAIEPRLTAAQIESIIRRTAKPLPGASFTWSNAAGFGVIDPEACLTETSRLECQKGSGLMRLTAFQSDKGDCLLLTNTAGGKQFWWTGACPSPTTRTSRRRWASSAPPRRRSTSSTSRTSTRTTSAASSRCWTTRRRGACTSFRRSTRTRRASRRLVPRPPKVLEIWHNALSRATEEQRGPDRGRAGGRGAGPGRLRSRRDPRRGAQAVGSDHQHRRSNPGLAPHLAETAQHSAESAFGRQADDAAQESEAHQDRRPAHHRSSVQPRRTSKTLRDEWNTWLREREREEARLKKLENAARRDEERLGSVRVRQPASRRCVCRRSRSATRTK